MQVFRIAALWIVAVTAVTAVVQISGKVMVGVKELLSNATGKVIIWVELRKAHSAL